MARHALDAGEADPAGLFAEDALDGGRLDAVVLGGARPVGAHILHRGPAVGGRGFGVDAGLSQRGGHGFLGARSVGLDVGAMSGFSNAVVDEEFFAGTTLRSNFLCNLGYADESALFQKLPRFEFDDVCSFA